MSLTSLQLSHPMYVGNNNSISSIGEKTLETTGIDRETVHFSEFNFRTDSTGKIDSFEMLFSGIQNGREVSYRASLYGEDKVIIAEQDKSLFSDSGPAPGQIFNTVHSYLQTVTPGSSPNISFNLENGANIIFDSKYVPVYAVENGQLIALQRIAFIENEVVHYFTICNGSNPILPTIDDNKIVGGSTSGVCRTCERNCIILLHQDQLPKARILEYG
ncbi:hypothetical protein J2741_000272 [Methanolinea mesophila]|uniref:hypothetical protein n=1 Tax=Methanolinea mesophila TaxID=547055 RepID=UPI001AE57C1C|nr:hypothetical protein [Methanolinea mesophila]MBP1927725.1 hypothetical protein [Methanolinea mesophila]